MNEEERTALRARIADVRAHIAQAAACASRSAEEIELLAVSKKKSLEEVRFAAQCGIRVFGENYVQEIIRKFPADNSDFSIHFIGQLQRNKVKYIINRVCMVQSLDRIDLAYELEKHAARAGIVLPVLIEVNAGREDQKGGVFPEDVPRLADQTAELAHLELRGLMIVTPLFAEAESVRPMFAESRALFVREAARRDPSFTVLSMGMSYDYAIAVEEGATQVRIGTSIFGARA